jgi:gliding motility-associated-like protein
VVSKELVINELAKADFSVQSNFCQSDPVYFTDLSTPNPVAWTWYISDLDTFDFQNPGYGFGIPGDYVITLTVVDSLCGTDTKKDTITIIAYPIVNIVANDLVCADQPVTLDAGNPGYTFLWSTGNTTQYFTTSFESTTNVWVIVNNQGCIAGDTITININCDITMPTGFSPNADGKNDKFRPRGRNVNSYDLYVYNRWGNLIYSITKAPGDMDNGWDGTIKGEPAEVGTYVYYLKSYMINDFVIEKQGNVTLLR